MRKSSPPPASDSDEMNLDDTIVAISSPPGAAWRGIVRLSGPKAVPIADRLLKPEAHAHLREPRTNRVLAGHVRLHGTDMPCQAFVFHAPRSYTRQDMVELHLLGAPGILALVVEPCLENGARRAEPGEFTARAFLAGAMDLSQVHGVAGMVAARSDQQLQAASRLLHGELARAALIAREEIADLLSLVEGALDFADEPIEFITPQALRQRLSAVVQSLESTAAAGLRMERWERLPHVLLAGPPNAGKSSLLNVLTGLDRAICTPIPGTTRDVITAPLQIGGSECLLVDTAGLGAAVDQLDARAQDVARRALESADLILSVQDASALDPQCKPDVLGLLFAHEKSAGPVVKVLNKADLIDPVSPLRASASETGCLFVSTVTGEGCDELKGRIRAVLHERDVDIHEDAVALMAEHHEALQQAVESARRAIALAEQSPKSLANADIVAAELRIAAGALAALVGQDDTESLLGRVFARFCVGK